MFVLMQFVGDTINGLKKFLKKSEGKVYNKRKVTALHKQEKNHSKSFFRLNRSLLS